MCYICTQIIGNNIYKQFNFLEDLIMSYNVTMTDTNIYVENGLNRYIKLLQGGKKDVLKHLIQLWNDYCESVNHLEDSIFDMTNEEDRILIAKMGYNVNLCVYAHCSKTKTQNPYFYFFEDNSDNNCVIKAIYKENIIMQIKCFGEGDNNIYA